MMVAMKSARMWSLDGSAFTQHGHRCEWTSRCDGRFSSVAFVWESSTSALNILCRCRQTSSAQVQHLAHVKVPAGRLVHRCWGTGLLQGLLLRLCWEALCSLDRLYCSRGLQLLGLLYTRDWRGHHWLAPRHLQVQTFASAMHFPTRRTSLQNPEKGRVALHYCGSWSLQYNIVAAADTKLEQETAAALANHESIRLLEACTRWVRAWGASEAASSCSWSGGREMGPPGMATRLAHWGPNSACRSSGLSWPPADALAACASAISACWICSGVAMASAACTEPAHVRHLHVMHVTSVSETHLFDLDNALGLI